MAKKCGNFKGSFEEVDILDISSSSDFHGTRDDVARFDGGAQYTVELIFEIEGSERPACVAECIYRVYT